MTTFSWACARCALFVGPLACPVVGYAGEFFSDFNGGLPPGSSVYGQGAVLPTGGVDNSGVLRLTENVPGQFGAFVLPLLDPIDALVTSFKANFQMRISDTTFGPADGLSFNFSSAIPNPPTYGNPGEEGLLTGLSINFDTWDNGGFEAPAIDVKFNGATVGHYSIQPYTGPRFVDVAITLTPDGLLDVDYDGFPIFQNLTTGHVATTGGQFMFGARTGAADSRHLIDNLSIVTNPEFDPSELPIVIRTSHGFGADTELREDEATQRGGAKDLNSRAQTSPVDMELIALRFDLSGISQEDRAMIGNAQLQMVVNRTQMPSNNGFQVYGLNSDVPGQDWVEGTSNSLWNADNPFPGMIYDGDPTTFPIDPEQTTWLGEVFWGQAPGLGAGVSFVDSALTSFLRQGDDLVTLFLFRSVPTSTQMRFASKETVTLGETGTNLPFGTGVYAPRLLFDILPPAMFNVYIWEFVDRNDPSQGKQESNTLAPDGYGVQVAPGIDLSFKNLKMAFLSGADLQSAFFYSSNLSDAYLSQANLSFATMESANLSGADLTQANFMFGFMQLVDLSDADLSGANLEGLNTNYVTWTGANFTNANVRGAQFYFDPFLSGFTGMGISLEQLYSTASYQERDLSGIGLPYHDLSGANFVNQNLMYAYFDFANLAGADLSGANLANTSFYAADLTDANFSNAIVREAFFYYEPGVGAGTITPEQLYSTFSYQERDLTGIGLIQQNLSGANFADQNLTFANFDQSDLTGADLSGANLENAAFYFVNLTDSNFTNAIVRGANFFFDPSFAGSGISLEQIYSTASYQERDLTGIVLPRHQLIGADFSGQKLANADLFEANLAGANLQMADLSNAFLYFADLTNADLQHASLVNVFALGVILDGANLSAADLRGATHDVVGLPTTLIRNTILPGGLIDGLQLGEGETLIVRDYDGFFDPNSVAIPIVVNQRFAMSEGGVLRMEFDEDGWGSPISFETGIPVTLGGTIELLFVDGVDIASQIGRTIKLFDWSGVVPMGTFDISSPHRWDRSQLYTTGEITLVPEPQSLLLVALGLVGLLARRSVGARRSGRSWRL